VREIWTTFTDEQRHRLKTNASVLASQEEWD
jgi:hypothetical protein